MPSLLAKITSQIETGNFYNKMHQRFHGRSRAFWLSANGRRALLRLISILDFSQALTAHRKSQGNRVTWSFDQGSGDLIGCISCAKPQKITLELQTSGPSSEIKHVPLGLVSDSTFTIRVPAEVKLESIALSSEGQGDAMLSLFQADNSLASRLCKTAAENFSQNKDPLTVLRTIDIAPWQEKATIDPDSWSVDNFAPDVPTHLRSVVNMAAFAEASEPQVEVGSLPLVSFIVPVFNAKLSHLDDILRSFRQQPEGLGELVFSDDASTSKETLDWLKKHENEPGVRVAFGQVNGGIAVATSAGLELTTGTWVSLLDHDDALVPFAVARIARAIGENPNCTFLYTDEVITDPDLQPTDYFLKPAWNEVLLSGVNYINHLSVYRKERLIEIGGFGFGYDGSQDYELLLRYTRGLAPSEILHLPYPAYLWRRSDTTYSQKFMEAATKNARKALSERYFGSATGPVEGALGGDLHRVRFDLAEETWPLISVIIPNKNAPEMMQMVLSGLYEKTDYPNLEVIVVDNGSTDQETIDLYALYKERHVNFRPDIKEEPFNFSRSVNRGLCQVNGEYVLLLNNDIEVTDALWLKEMVSCFRYDNVGIVGAKLLYPNRLLQHAGVIAGFGGLAGHWFVEEPEDFPGPMGRLYVRQEMSCVTGACMLISKACIDALGDFDEVNFAVAYNDVDYSLRAVAAGWRIVWTPFACLVHHESASRGSDEVGDNAKRFMIEQENLRKAHNTQAYSDRALNPWYSRGYSFPRPVFLEHLPQAR